MQWGNSPRCDNEYGSETAKKKQTRLINLVRILIVTWSEDARLRQMNDHDNEPSGTRFAPNGRADLPFLKIYSQMSRSTRRDNDVRRVSPRSTSQNSNVYFSKRQIDLSRVKLAGRGFRILSEERSSRVIIVRPTRAACDLIRAINDLFDNRYHGPTPSATIRSVDTSHRSPVRFRRSDCPFPLFLSFLLFFVGLL